MKNLLIFDVGGTSVKYTMYVNDHLLEIQSFVTPKSWEKMKRKMADIKSGFEKSHKIEGIAFSLPGCVDNVSGIIKGASAISYIHHFPIKKELEEFFNLPVSMENDANCAGLAESWIGAAKGRKKSLFIVAGTGIGGAIINNGKLDVGNHCYGGEFGFMILNAEGPKGERTLSELCSPVRIGTRYCESIGVEAGSHSGKEVFTLAKLGDENAVREVEKFYRYMAIGLFNLQMSFDPEIMVIGGGISANSEIIQEIENRLNDKILEFKLKDFRAKVVPCQYKNDTNLLGAAKQFFSEHA